MSILNEIEQRLNPIEWDADGEAYVDTDEIEAQLFRVGSDKVIVSLLVSKKQGEGNARRFLQSLKDQFKTVHASGVDEKSFPFWDKMRRERLVDSITDDTGADL